MGASEQAKEAPIADSNRFSHGVKSAAKRKMREEQSDLSG
jgi:hypothetical protein